MNKNNRNWGQPSIHNVIFNKNYIYMEVTNGRNITIIPQTKVTIMAKKLCIILDISVQRKQIKTKWWRTEEAYANQVWSQGPNTKI